MFGMTQRFLMLLFLVMAFASAAQADAAEDLRSYVDEKTQKMVAQLNQERGLYESDPEAFYASMDASLEEFVDFRRIAARVMGRYARQTTPEQRDEFVAKFKRSLFDSYAQALVNTEDFSIEVNEAVINPRDEDRASVQMEVITASGNRYPVTYSMYKSGEGVWLMENVIVEGVNIGLAFRDRFAQEMEQNRGQVDVVIDDWGDAVKSLNLEEEVDKS
ncbi:ABC transporter substrate-binding protein [Marinobacter sp. chi1]|uniref:ABC transporter substrate-binding protein n=2 Tax=Marinobacteraceae TaxID=2887365 RepID=A0ABT8VWK8_9GAMM|nr:MULTISPECIES: ABC transporter substrate-binding protein [unclassified Marinobacter]MBZ2168466.1 ABC transporter substrate-binding protein [Marinobacter sp. F4216]MDO3720364.1 ABC transporter substrate-binding protein [Marinobacter sp. chi1]